MHKKVRGTIKKINPEADVNQGTTIPKHFLGLILLAACLACGEKPVYDAYVAIPESGWNKDSAISFTVPVKNAAAKYYVEVSVRNTDDYPFRNVWFFREVASSKGIEYTDTAQYYLANAYGEWTGEGVGELKTNDFPYKSNQRALQFADTGTYTFTFTQAMRTEQLPGLTHLGLRLYQVNNTPEKNTNGSGEKESR